MFCTLPQIIFMNWPVLIVVGIICIAIIVLTFLKDRKDEEEFEEHAHQDYPKPHHDHPDADPEETPK